MYDFVVVGSGLFGSVFTQKAIEAGNKVLVVEQREHIAGNCYSENIGGIEVHKYGPHIFHCSSEKIWNYVNKFSKFNHFTNRPKVTFGDKIYSFPINMMTLYQMWGVKTPAEAAMKLESVRYKIEKPTNFEEWVLSQVGKEIYETFFEGYTRKQWGKSPEDLPAGIAKRIPIRLTWDDNYFNDQYQGIPMGGYTQMFRNMLEGAEVQLGVDFFKERATLENLAKRIVYTGKVDQFFNYVYGDLEYRSLRFDTKQLDVTNYQGIAQMNHTSIDVPYTRTTEHRHFEFDLDESKKTVVTWEYPIQWDRNQVPYYPVNDSANNSLYQKYDDLKSKAEDSKRYIFGGRLASFKYYDMHQVIGEALATWTRIC